MDCVDEVDSFFTGESFDAIPASTFADGRFLLFVTASADIKGEYGPYIELLEPDFIHTDYHDLDLIPLVIRWCS